MTYARASLLSASLLIFLLIAAFPTPPAHAESSSQQVDILGKAVPDECFGGITNPPSLPPPYVPLGPSGCPNGMKPKVNQAYVWGLTQTNQDWWFGTAANVNCLVEGVFLQRTDAYETSAWACEFGQSGFRAALAQRTPPVLLPPAIGYWRPSLILRKPMNGGPIVNMGARMDSLAQSRLSQTIGLRSAGNFNGVVLLAGPALNPLDGLYIFAFNANTQGFIGSTNIPGYSNIRKWIVAQGALYTTVAVQGGTGALLKWTGSINAPFALSQVGTTPSEGAELIEHAGRIFVGTWPYLNGQTVTYAGLFETPLLPNSGGLPASNAPLTKIWDARAYEPDPLVASTYGGGAMASYMGHLVFGTMHVPGVATQLQLRFYSSYYNSITDPTQLQAETFLALLATQRAIAIFSVEGLGANPQPSSISLLYGQAYLPVFNPSNHQWVLQRNNSNLEPSLGPSGFGNPFNNYTWTMALAGDASLYVGTMDWLYLLEQGVLAQYGVSLPTNYTELDQWLNEIERLQPQSSPLIQSVEGYLAGIRGTINGARADFLSPGADLAKFQGLAKPAVIVSNNGLGNYLNYGFRTMIGSQSQLIIGTANPMNLMTSSANNLPKGGWELLRLGLQLPIAIPPTPVPAIPGWGNLLLIALLIFTLSRSRVASHKLR